MAKQRDNIPVGLSAAHMLLELALHIPFLQGEKPIGIMIVAPPGMGKSMLLTRFESPYIQHFNDLSGWGFQQVLLSVQKIHGGYVVIPDLLRLMARRNGWEAFVAFSNVVLEEGFQGARVWDTNVQLKQPLHVGVICALTTECYERYVRQFQRSGFLSRFVVFQFDYSPSDRTCIETLLSCNHNTANKKILIQPSKRRQKRTVKISKTTGNTIRRLGTMLCNGDNARFRSIVFVRRLCKASALMNRRACVTLNDVRVIFSLLPFLLPIHPAATDLIYHLLRGASVKNLKKRYSEQEIDDAQRQLVSRHLDWLVFSKK